jgi:hypothetical protein
MYTRFWPTLGVSLLANKKCCQDPILPGTNTASLSCPSNDAGPLIPRHTRAHTHTHTYTHTRTHKEVITFFFQVRL